MDICACVTWFGIASLLGWVWECTFCAIKNKKWDNRGFLFGPVCPIYGCGLVAVILIATSLPLPTPRSAPDVPWWEVFLAASLGSAVLEYGTSYVLERLFHARWWDYSHVPLNLNGRICLPFALGFGAAGTLLYYFACPFIFSNADATPLVVWEVAGLLTAALMSLDLGLTVSAMTNVTQRIEQTRSNFDAVMETAVTDIASGRPPLQDDAREATRHVAEGMSLVQRRALRSVRSFTTDARNEAASRLREAVDSVKKAGRR